MGAPRETQRHEVTRLGELSTELLDKARTVNAGRAARSIAGGRDHVLGQTLLALREGAELAEHDSPPEATLQVFAGRVTLGAVDGQSWTLSTGDFIPIPDQRHWVRAEADSVFLLTVIRD